MPPSESPRAVREKTVLDHFRDEVRQEWDDVLSTFPHPRYELVPTMTVHDGDTAVRGYYHDTRVAFPDQHHEIIALRHADDAVIVEFWLMGTHQGAGCWRCRAANPIRRSPADHPPLINRRYSVQRVTETPRSRPTMAMTRKHC
ncbi:hypothetical protein HDA40_000106 [Hamadaea flava]|nr:hypothetical protein [Hamadaea flava]